MFIAINKDTKEIIEGTWQQLHNLDKRIWTLVQPSKELRKPLCILDVECQQPYEPPDPEGINYFFKIKPIYSLHDLVGVFI